MDERKVKRIYHPPAIPVADLFIRSLKRQPNQMDSWNNTIWTVMVEKAIVHKDGSITFMFYNGRSVTVR